MYDITYMAEGKGINVEVGTDYEATRKKDDEGADPVRRGVIKGILGGLAVLAGGAALAAAVKHANQQTPSEQEAQKNSQNLQNRKAMDDKTAATAEQAKKEGERVQSATGQNTKPFAER